MKAKGVIALWDEYEKTFGRPAYARCMVQFKDDQSLSNVTIALYSNGEDNEDDPNDEDIFFYAEGREDFIRLCDANNGEDFYVTQIYYFSINFPKRTL